MSPSQLHYVQAQQRAHPAVVGKTIRLGSATLEIVGVSPAGFRGIQLGAEVDVWLDSVQK